MTPEVGVFLRQLWPTEFIRLDTISGKRHLVKEKDTMSFHPSEYLNLPKLLYSYNYRAHVLGHLKL